jgi:SAM-dependent methyltransferase
MADNLIGRLATYFTNKLRTHGATAEGAGWRDQESQELRFSKLVQVTRGAKKGRLVEVGCGWGAFALWARRQGYELDYVGYDINPDMVQAAREKCRDLPKTSFELGDGPFAEADWVIASGIFNLRFDTPDAEWRKRVDDTVEAMARAARLGFAFNFLTGFSDPDRKEFRLYYPDPGEMLSSVMSRHGRTAVLLHDYPLYEFTIFVWKFDERRRARNACVC